MAAVAGLSRDPIADSDEISAGILTDFRRWPTKARAFLCMLCVRRNKIDDRGIDDDVDGYLVN